MGRHDRDHRPGTFGIVDPMTGEVVQVPYYFGLPRRLNPSDPFDTVYLQTSTSTGFTYKVGFSRVLGQPTEWSIVSGPSGQAGPIVSRGVNGAGIGMGEFLEEDHYVGPPDNFLHNPTISGAFFTYFPTAVGQVLPAALQRAMHPPIVQHLKHTQQGRLLLCEAATLPFEFNPDGAQGAGEDIGCRRSTTAFYPLFKNFIRFEIKDDIAHELLWRYSPVEWSVGANNLRDVTCLAGAGFSFIGSIFRDAALFFDPFTGKTLVDLSTMWHASTNLQLLRGFQNGFDTLGDTVTAFTPWTLGSEWLAALITSNAGFGGADPITVGILARIYLDEQQCKRPTSLELTMSNPLATSTLDGGSQGNLSSQTFSNFGRRAGWLKLEQWFTVGITQTAVRTRLQALAADLIKNPSVWSSDLAGLPPHVLANTRVFTPPDP